MFCFHRLLTFPFDPAKFLDKTLLNYSSIFGIKTALHLTGSDYSWLGSAFYLGYIVGALMWAKLVQRWPQHVGKFISGAVTVWACITLLTRGFALPFGGCLFWLVWFADDLVLGCSAVL